MTNELSEYIADMQIENEKLKQENKAMRELLEEFAKKSTEADDCRDFVEYYAGRAEALLKLLESE